MEKNVPLGPHVMLPSIEGLSSSCEKELYILMKEIDTAFERKHKDLIDEVVSLKASNRSGMIECEKLKTNLRDNEDSYKKHIQLLEKESNRLKIENESLCDTLQRRYKSGSEQDSHILKLEGTIISQQRENDLLKENLAKLEEQHNVLQHRYKNCEELLLSKEVLFKDKKTSRTPDWLPNFISEETDRHFKEEEAHRDEFMKSIQGLIEKLKNDLESIKLEKNC